MNGEDGDSDRNQEFFYEKLFGFNDFADAGGAGGKPNKLQQTQIPTTTETTDKEKQERQQQQPVISEHESHCTSCFNHKQCQKKRLSSCQIVYCRLKCGHLFHQCKSAEHEECMCPRKKVPCLNVDYGCPFKMERQFVANHLEKCPASVVVCTVEWNRKPLSPWQSEHYESYASNPNYLDIAATKYDELTVKEYYKLLPTSLRSLLRSGDKKQTIMPLGVAGTRIPNSILHQTVLEKRASKSDDKITNGLPTPTNEMSGYEDLSSEEEDSSSLISFSEPSYGIRGKSPSAGLQQSVCSQLVKEPSVDKGNEEGAATANNTSPCKKKSHVRLSPTVDVVVKDGCKYMNLFTFMCSHEFRRDEYGSHFKNIHTEIMTQLNGWLFTRCPMAIYGCDFGTERAFPTAVHLEGGSNPEEYEIIRNEELDAFCFRQKQVAISKMSNGDNGEGEAASSSGLHICDLPEELLILITKYLDPLSLNALSMTSKRFLSICEQIVSERGIVVLDWEKKSYNAENPSLNETGWKVVGNRWMFTKHFSPIRRWKYLEPGVLSNHLTHCPIMEEQRNRPAKPFSYPFTQDNL